MGPGAHDRVEQFAEIHRAKRSGLFELWQSVRRRGAFVWQNGSLPQLPDDDRYSRLCGDFRTGAD